MYNEIINNINKKIIDVRMKNRLNEYIKNILEKNGKIKILYNIVIKNSNQKLIIKKQKDYISYIYKDKEYQEKYQIFKIEKDYISELQTKQNKQISVFNKEQEKIKHIEEKGKETTYIRTQNNNIILIEKDINNIKYYIGINENKYENYIPQNIIFEEIEKDEYIDLISQKIEEGKLLQRYFLTEKKFHLL